MSLIGFPKDFVPITTEVNGHPLSGDVTLTTEDIADTTDNRYVTDADLVVLSNTSNTNSGDQDLSNLQIKVVPVNVTSNINVVNKLATGPSGYTPIAGDLIMASFTNGNGATAVTLNINSTGALTLELDGTTTIGATFTLDTGADVLLYFNGTNLLVIGSQRNSTYTNMTTAEILAGTGTTARSISAQRLRYAFDNLLATPSVSGTIAAADKIKLDNTSGTNTGDQDLSGYESLSNKQTNLTSSSTKYPTVDAVNTGLALKADLSSADFTALFLGGLPIASYATGTNANGNYFIMYDAAGDELVVIQHGSYTLSTYPTIQNLPINMPTDVYVALPMGGSGVRSLPTVSTYTVSSFGLYVINSSTGAAVTTGGGRWAAIWVKV